MGTSFRSIPRTRITSPHKWCLRPEQVFHRLPHDLAADVGDGLGERNVFGADFDAVLRVAALLDAAVAHQGFESIDLQRLPCWVIVEQTHLRYGGSSYEAGMFVELRAGFHAAAAGNAAGERINFFLFSSRLARAGAEVVGAVGRNPCLYLLQVLEEHAAIYRKVADYRELGERLEPDRLFELVDQRRA